MKKQKRREVRKEVQEVAQAAPSRLPPWWVWLAGFGALFLVFEAYEPALHSPFVLDDIYLPYASPNAPLMNIWAWVRQQRPLLMFSYWVNYQMGGSDPHIYHTTNVAFHFIASVITMFIAARLLEWAGVAGRLKTALAIFAGAIFLLHPLQTESVAYVASRSDVLSTLFYYAAFAVFIYANRDSMTWVRAIAIVVLFGAAAATKEHTLTLPILILLTDYFWNRGGLRKNGILYGLLAACCAAGGVLVWKVLAIANTAGFNVRDFSPLSYFFTQCRVIWIYIRMFFLPFGQNVDPDIAISNGVLDHGAWIGLIALVAAVVFAWIFRKRWPLAAFGILVFLLLIAPTSSVVPIRDVLAERRVYLPFLGLILIALEIFRHLRLQYAVGAGAVVVLVLTVLTYQRSEVWSSPMALWQDAVLKSPNKMRPLFQLAFAQYDSGECGLAAKNFEVASHLEAPDYRLLVDWANALDCMANEDEAAKVFGRAIAYNPASAEAYVGLAAVYGKQRKVDLAFEALMHAEAIDPSIGQIYVNRGALFEIQGNVASAVAQYRRALQIDPSNRLAHDALRRLGQ